MKSMRLGFRKGAALSFVIIVFVIVTAVTVILYTFFSANIRQTYLQEKNLQAYYCTVTGIELAKAALVMKVDNPAYRGDLLTPGVPDKISLLDKFIADPARTMSHQDLYLPTGGPNGNGTPSGSGSKVTVDVSTLEKGDPPELWICIRAEGTYVDAAGKPFINKGSLLFLAENPEINEQYFDFVPD